MSIQCFAGAESCVGLRQTEGEPYEFARTPEGWVTRPLGPSASRFAANSVWAVDPNEHTVLFSAPTPPQGQDDWYAGREGTITQIGPVAEGGLHGPTGGLQELPYAAIAEHAATGNLSHVVYRGSSPFWTFGGVLEGKGLYEYVGSGSARPVLVGVSGGQGSTDLLSTCGTDLGGVSGGPSAYGSLSADGRTVYFTAVGHNSPTCLPSDTAPPSNELFARIDGEAPDAHTIAISEPQALEPGPRKDCSSAECIKNTEKPAPPATNPNWTEATFAGAASDGSKVFFQSEQQLTDEAGGGGENLYMSECPEPCAKPAEEQRLIDVSKGAKESGGPRVQGAGAVAISPDGSHVYFVAQGKLTSAPNALGQHAENGGDNLYVYSEGQLAFITALSGSDSLNWTFGIIIANVTPDGRFLVFTSHKALTADDTRPEGPEQVYRYDAQTGVLVRVSIGERGFDDNGNQGTANASIVRANRGFLLGVGPGRADPTMSNDGQYVFFESPNALAPGALNDFPAGNQLAQNIYEYHDGQVYLISDGKDTTEHTATLASTTELLGSDATGANVFFATNDQLVSRDTDTQLDYYDAHINGGVSVTAAPTPCEGEACQEPSGAPPVFGAPSSSTFSGPGNLVTPPPTSGRGSKPQKTAAQVRAEKLARALKACHATKSKHQRATCEKQARKRFDPTKTAKKK